MLKVLFFGELKALTATDVFEVEGIQNTGKLIEILRDRWPGLQGKIFSIAVNKKIQAETVNLKEGDEVALLPPFSGG